MIRISAYKQILPMALMAMAIGGCQKMNRPELAANYPKDTNPAGGPLKFYAAFDNTNVDSIRANFGQNVNATYTEGINGKGMNAGVNGYSSTVLPMILSLPNLSPFHFG